MNYVECVNTQIRHLIAQSKVPEDPLHAENTIMWLLKLNPHADEALRIAALGHDIERAVEDRRLKKENFTDFDAFKAAHAQNSADILRDIMHECNVPETIASETCRLVALHETGGDIRSDLLRDADSLSFFHVNLPFYYKRCGRDETIRRGFWGYRRISPVNRALITDITYEEDYLIYILKDIIQMASH